MEPLPSLLDEAFDQSTPEHEDEQEHVGEQEYGLLYRGYLKDTVNIGPHTISIRTLRIGEELDAALLAQKYKGSVEEGRAIATAIVAASIVAVDDKPLIEQALGHETDNTLEAKFRYILKNWYWVTVKDIYAQYNELYGKVLDTYDAVKKD